LDYNNGFNGLHNFESCDDLKRSSRLERGFHNLIGEEKIQQIRLFYNYVNSCDFTPIYLYVYTPFNMFDI